MPTRSSTIRQNINNNNKCFKHKMENINGLHKNKYTLEQRNEVPLNSNNNSSSNIEKKSKTSSSTATVTLLAARSQSPKTLLSQIPINTNNSLTKRYFLRSSTNKQQQNLLEIQENGKIIKNNRKCGKKRTSTTSSTINTRRVSSRKK